MHDLTVNWSDSHSGTTVRLYSHYALWCVCLVPPTTDNSLHSKKSPDHIPGHAFQLLFVFVLLLLLWLTQPLSSTLFPLFVMIDKWFSGPFDIHTHTHTHSWHHCVRVCMPLGLSSLITFGQNDSHSKTGTVRILITLALWSLSLSLFPSLHSFISFHFWQWHFIQKRQVARVVLGPKFPASSCTERLIGSD